MNGKGDWNTTTPPTASAISTQVWTDQPAVATFIGTNAPSGWINAAAIASSAMNGKGDWNTTTPPTAVAISLVVDTQLSGVHGGGPWGGGGIVGVGTGIIPWPVVCEVAGVPQDGVEVWVSTDSSGSTVVAGPVQTDIYGRVTFYLNAGTYYVWRQLGGFDYVNPQTMVVA
jgi:hypothetical protein